MMMSMMVVGRSPRLFHFKPDLKTGELLGPRLYNLFQNNPDQRLLLSLFQAASRLIISLTSAVCWNIFFEAYGQGIGLCRTVR
jgi:hypothetical protein